MSGKRHKQIRRDAIRKALEPGVSVMTKVESRAVDKAIKAGLTDVLEQIAGMPFKARLKAAWSLIRGRTAFSRYMRL